MDVNGKNTQDVLTGQVPVESLCRDHRAVAHDAEGTDAMRWCHRCGKNDKGEQKVKPNGGWA